VDIVLLKKHLTEDTFDLKNCSSQPFSTKRESKVKPEEEYLLPSILNNH